MNPFEIVRRTPKTNCGQCGHAACLAFAAKRLADRLAKLPEEGAADTHPGPS